MNTVLLTKNEPYTREDFVFFWHEYPHDPVQKTCLSQWYACNFYVSGIEYFTTEQ